MSALEARVADLERLVAGIQSELEGLVKLGASDRLAYDLESQIGDLARRIDALEERNIPADGWQL